MSNDAPRGDARRIVDAWPGLLEELQHNRDLRLNLLGAIVDATRAEWRRRKGSALGGGSALVGEEGRALADLEAKLRESFRDLDGAVHRVSLWASTVEAGDRRGWGRS